MLCAVFRLRCSSLKPDTPERMRIGSLFLLDEAMSLILCHPERAHHGRFTVDTSRDYLLSVLLANTCRLRGDAPAT